MTANLQDFHLAPTLFEGCRAKHPRGDIQARSFIGHSVLGESGQGRRGRPSNDRLRHGDLGRSMPHVHYRGRLRLGGGNYLDPDALNFCRFSKTKNRAIFNVDDITCHWRDSTRPSRLLLGRPFRTWNGQSNRPFKPKKSIIVLCYFLTLYSDTQF
jgi:hypothetical protein